MRGLLLGGGIFGQFSGLFLAPNGHTEICVHVVMMITLGAPGVVARAAANDGRLEAMELRVLLDQARNTIKELSTMMIRYEEENARLRRCLDEVLREQQWAARGQSVAQRVEDYLARPVSRIMRGGRPRAIQACRYYPARHAGHYGVHQSIARPRWGRWG